MKPTPNERSELLRLARTLLAKIESGEVVSFIAICAIGAGGNMGTIIAGHSDWAREALAVALAQMPSPAGGANNALPH